MPPRKKPNSKVHQDALVGGNVDPPGLVLVEAIESLYDDRIFPQQSQVLGRIHENSGQKWQPQQLLKLCEVTPQVCVQVVAEGTTAQSFNVFLNHEPTNFRGFVDDQSMEDPYPDQLWQAICIFLQTEVEQAWPSPAEWPGSRYHFAKLIHSRLLCLKPYSLGQVCHIVQLCIRKRALLGYHQGNLVPYAFSDDSKKQANAMLHRPTQLTAGEAYVQSWEEASRLLGTLLREEGGAVQLSSLKVMFRKRFQVALSESALGHTKLSELILDRNLTGGFSLARRGTDWHVVHVEKEDSTAEGSSASDQESSSVEQPSQSSTGSGAIGGINTSPTSSRTHSADFTAELPSVGSAGHFSGQCSRCCFFPKGRCSNGKECKFCHFEHDKVRRKASKLKGGAGTEVGALPVDEEEEEDEDDLYQMDTYVQTVPPQMSTQPPEAPRVEEAFSRNALHAKGQAVIAHLGAQEMAATNSTNLRPHPQGPQGIWLPAGAISPAPRYSGGYPKSALSPKSCMSLSPKSCMSPKNSLTPKHAQSPKSTSFASHAYVLHQQVAGPPVKVTCAPINDLARSPAKKLGKTKKLKEDKFHSCGGISPKNFQEQPYEVRGTFLHIQARKEDGRRCSSAPPNLSCYEAEGLVSVPSTPVHRKQHFSVLPGNQVLPGELPSDTLPSSTDQDQVHD